MVTTPTISSPKRKTMSITHTYFLAHKARAKLSREAAQPDHNLRLLVGHANLLDSLMLDLADAEREQESWFNKSVSGASKGQDRHIQWADNVAEPESDWGFEEDSDSGSDSGSDSDLDEEEDIEVAEAAYLRRVTPNKDAENAMDFSEEDEEEDFAQLTLTRSPSRSSASPPELDHDSDSSDDEVMPLSPPTATLPTFLEKEEEEPIAGEYYDSRQDYSEDIYLPQRNATGLISAVSVY